MSDVIAPLDVFYSYADADNDLCIALDKHLSQLRREGLITTLHKRQIIASQNQKEVLDQRLSNASVILLLVSPDFIASDYCYGTEVQRAMERHKAKEAHVIPILLRPVDWQNAPFGQLRALPRNETPVTKWRNRDEAFLDIAQGIRVALEDIQLPAVRPPHTDFPPVWNVPYHRNPFFTGQEEVLAQLADALKVSQSAALSQPQAINGLGGIGKTQIATEYAFRYGQDYEAVLWTKADTRESLVSGYVAIAGELNLPEKDEQDQSITVNAVIRWLSIRTRWLLILDGADEIDVVREFLPRRFGGHILLTTRAQIMGELADRIEVLSMSQDVGALFLLRRARLLDRNVPLENADASDFFTAKAISEELGGLPLALDQAGAYIEETQCSLSEYMRLFRTRRAEMLKKRGQLTSEGYPESVATTWSLSFEKVEQRCAAAGDLLRLCAFLSPDAIPEEIITEGAAHLDTLLQPVASDPLLLNEAISALAAYSLIRRNGKMKMLSIHRLVQAVIQDAMAEEVRRDWAGQAVQAVNGVFPEEEFATWPQCERYLPHALSCAEHIERELLSSLEAARLLYETGRYLIERARVSEAFVVLWQALAIRERCLGPEHAAIADVVDRLARCFEKLGRYTEAEPLFKRALHIREQQLGKTHPKTATILNNLAVLYYGQGRYEEAESLHKRALGIRVQRLGEMHPSTATSLINLAGLYHSQGRYAEAEPVRSVHAKPWQHGGCMAG